MKGFSNPHERHFRDYEGQAFVIAAEMCVRPCFCHVQSSARGSVSRETVVAPVHPSLACYEESSERQKVLEISFAQSARFSAYLYCLDPSHFLVNVFVPIFSFYRTDPSMSHRSSFSFFHDT